MPVASRLQAEASDLLKGVDPPLKAHRPDTTRQRTTRDVPGVEEECALKPCSDPGNGSSGGAEADAAVGTHLESHLFDALLPKSDDLAGFAGKRQMALLALFEAAKAKAIYPGVSIGGRSVARRDQEGEGHRAVRSPSRRLHRRKASDERGTEMTDPSEVRGEGSRGEGMATRQAVTRLRRCPILGHYLPRSPPRGVN